MDKTPQEAWTLLDNRALNDQQFAVTLNSTKKVSEAKALESKLDAVLAHLTIGASREPVKVCGVCSLQGHPTDQCPQLIESGEWESANAIGQPRYNPFSNVYNPGTRDHPNFRWSNTENATSQPPNFGGQFQRPSGFVPRP